MTESQCMEFKKCEHLPSRECERCQRFEIREKYDLVF